MEDFNVKLFLKILFGVIFGLAALVCGALFLPQQIFGIIIGVFFIAAIIICLAFSIYDDMTDGDWWLGL